MRTVGKKATERRSPPIDPALRAGVSTRYLFDSCVPQKQYSDINPIMLQALRDHATSCGIYQKVDDFGRNYLTFMTLHIDPEQANADLEALAKTFKRCYGIMPEPIPCVINAEVVTSRSGDSFHKYYVSTERFATI